VGEHYQTLVAPDPELLLELLSDDFFRKIMESKICLIVDDDGTISDSLQLYVDWLSRKLRRPIKIEECERYDFLDIDPQALGMLKTEVFSDSKLHRGLPVINGAAEVLGKIAEAGVPIIILTARPMLRSMVIATRKHKEDNNIPFDLLIFSRRKKEIIKAIKKLGCHVVVVDDDPKVAIETYRLSDVTAILFSAFYNMHVERKGIVRAGENPEGHDGWSVVLEEVLERHK